MKYSITYIPGYFIYLDWSLRRFVISRGYTYVVHLITRQNNVGCDVTLDDGRRIHHTYDCDSCLWRS